MGLAGFTADASIYTRLGYYSGTTSASANGNAPAAVTAMVLPVKGTIGEFCKLFFVFCLRNCEIYPRGVARFRCVEKCRNKAEACIEPFQ